MQIWMSVVDPLLRVLPGAPWKDPENALDHTFEVPSQTSCKWTGTSRRARNDSCQTNFLLLRPCQTPPTPPKKKNWPRLYIWGTISNQTRPTQTPQNLPQKWPRSFEAPFQTTFEGMGTAHRALNSSFRFIPYKRPSYMYRLWLYLGILQKG